MNTLVSPAGRVARKESQGPWGAVTRLWELLEASLRLDQLGHWKSISPDSFRQRKPNSHWQQEWWCILRASWSLCLWVCWLKSLVPLMQKQLDLCNAKCLPSCLHQLEEIRTYHWAMFVHSELWFSPGLQHWLLVFERHVRAVSVFACMSPSEAKERCVFA